MFICVRELFCITNKKKSVYIEPVFSLSQDLIKLKETALFHLALFKNVSIKPKRWDGKIVDQRQKILYMNQIKGPVNLFCC